MSCMVPVDSGWTVAGIGIRLRAIGEGRRIVALKRPGRRSNCLVFQSTTPRKMESRLWTYRHTAALDLLADHGADVIGLQALTPFRFRIFSVGWRFMRQSEQGLRIGIRPGRSARFYTAKTVFERRRPEVSGFQHSMGGRVCSLGTGIAASVYLGASDRTSDRADIYCV